MEISPTAPPEPLPRIGYLRRYFADRPELGVAAVYLFGSHVAGRAHRESDVDLGVLLRKEAQPQRNDRFAVKLRLSGELGGVVAPAAADVVILNDAPPLLGRHVVNAGTRIYLGDAAVDHAYVRDIQLRAADLEPWLRRMRQLKLDWLAGRPAAMSPVVERLVELQRHLDHLRSLRPRVTDADALGRDLSLHNDVLFSLLTVCQLVFDIAAELSARRGLRFDDYTGAVANLSAFAEIPPAVVHELLPLPGYRNVLIHEYVALDLDRAIEALDRLDAVARFAVAVRDIEADSTA